MRTSTMTHDQVFQELANRKIKRVVISFSGGNDEGGADGITVEMLDGTEAQMDDGARAYVQTVYSGGSSTQKTVVYETGTDGRHKERPATPEEIARGAFFDALEQPIYDKYHTFAGEFSVYGTLTWDTTDRSVVLTGQESVEHYEEFEDRL